MHTTYRYIYIHTHAPHTVRIRIQAHHYQEFQNHYSSMTIRMLSDVEWLYNRKNFRYDNLTLTWLSPPPPPRSSYTHIRAQALCAERAYVRTDVRALHWPGYIAIN